jgi:hypothetical protein
MLKFVRAFWDVAIWRRTPAQLPASILLLSLVAAISAILEAVASRLPAAPPGGIFMRVAISVIMPLAFVWLILAVTRRRQRFLQTGTALLGVGIFAGVIIYPLESIINHIGVDQPSSLPLGVLSMSVLIWYLLTCANIWRAALESHLVLGGVISLGYFLLSMVVEQQWLKS